MIKVSNPKGILIAALIALGLVGIYQYAGQGSKLPDTLMMSTRISEESEPSYDATKWFRSGMYEPEDAFGHFNTHRMKRSKPIVLTAKYNEFLVQAAIDSLKSNHPGVDTQVLLMTWPVLTRRVRYMYSLFISPDKPADLYELYLQVSDRRFVINLQLDDEGVLKFDGDDVEVGYDDPLFDEHTKVFEEMDDAGTR